MTVRDPTTTHRSVHSIPPPAPLFFRYLPRSPRYPFSDYSYDYYLF